MWGILLFFFFQENKIAIPINPKVPKAINILVALDMPSLSIFISVGASVNIGSNVLSG